MTGAPLNWQKFNADKPNPATEQKIKELQAQLLTAAGVDVANASAVKTFAAEHVARYEQGENQGLNKAYMIDTFRPREFDPITANDASLLTLQQFLLGTSFSWNEGSKRVQQALYGKFAKAGSVRVAGGREYVDLDNLIKVADKTVAIEIETSINLDNGYFTLRLAVRSKKADYGVMVVPWTAEGPGRADEAKALGRLDREFDGATDLRDGPIYRIAIVRGVDLLRPLRPRGMPK